MKALSDTETGNSFSTRRSADPEAIVWWVQVCLVKSHTWNHRQPSCAREAFLNLFKATVSGPRSRTVDRLLQARRSDSLSPSHCFNSHSFRRFVTEVLAKVQVHSLTLLSVTHVLNGDVKTKNIFFVTFTLKWKWESAQRGLLLRQNYHFFSWCNY